MNGSTSDGGVVHTVGYTTDNSCHLMFSAENQNLVKVESSEEQDTVSSYGGQLPSISGALNFRFKR